MRHKYLRHKCLWIWGEIAKLNVAECKLSNWIAKINVAKSLKIRPNANIYVAKSNVHMPKLLWNLSSYKEFRVYKDTFIHIFPNSENFGVLFSTTAIYSGLGRVFFIFFSCERRKWKNDEKKNSDKKAKPQKFMSQNFW